MLELSGYRIINQTYEDDFTAYYNVISDDNNREATVRIDKHPSSMSGGRHPLLHDLALVEKYNLSAKKIYKEIRNIGRSAVLIMEPGEFIPLSIFIEKHPLSFDRVLIISLKLALEIDKIHDAGIIHQNITPANIFINQQTNEIILTNFSRATILKRDYAADSRDVPVNHPVQYISPEQTGLTNRSIDYRSDYYMMGIIMYQLTTGSPLYRHEPQ